MDRTRARLHKTKNVLDRMFVVRGVALSNDGLHAFVNVSGPSDRVPRGYVLRRTWHCTRGKGEKKHSISKLILIVFTRFIVFLAQKCRDSLRV